LTGFGNLISNRITCNKWCS